MVTKYGVISDIHEDPRVIDKALNTLREEGIDKLLINGDIGSSQAHTAYILDKIGDSGYESYIQPGSHESIDDFEPVMDHMSNQYQNIIDTIKNRTIEFSDHNLVFLPGSDFLCGGEYQIGNSEELPSGKYIRSEMGLKFEDFLKFYSISKELGSKYKGTIHYFNMQDITNLVTDPEKTVLVCHVPRKFDNLETCVDMAEFGITDGFNLYKVLDNGTSKILIERLEDNHQEFIEKIRPYKLTNVQNVHNGSIFPLPTAQKFLQIGAPIELKKENRGNEDLRNLYQELGITKAVSGHFHESSHRANDSNGNHVEPNTQTTDLFWNASYLDQGKCGILTVDGKLVSYQNITI